MMPNRALRVGVKFTFHIPWNEAYVVYRGSIEVSDPKSGENKVVGEMTFHHAFISYAGNETYDMGHNEDEPGQFQFWTLDPISTSGTQIHRAILSERYVEEHGFIDSLVLLDSLEIDEEYRGQGIATAALQHWLRWARSTLPNLGTHIFLYAVPDEEEAPEQTKAKLERLFRLYARMGFERLGGTDVMALNLERLFPFEQGG